MTDEDRAWLRLEFERCAPYIQAALDEDDIGGFELEDVWDWINTDKAQLWPTPNSAVVTALECFPRKKVIRYWLCGGILAECLESHTRIENWAKRNGATCAAISGRKGWLRALPGYKISPTVLMTKVL